MKKCLTKLLLIFAVATVASCHIDHEYRCKMNTEVAVGYVDQLGGNGWQDSYSIVNQKLAYYDMATYEKIDKEHYHKNAQFYGAGYYPIYLSPDICEKTFPNIRIVCTTEFEKLADKQKYFMRDTIDARLEYKAIDVCSIIDYSLNGTVVWSRDTGGQGWRYCHILVDEKRMELKYQQ